LIALHVQVGVSLSNIAKLLYDTFKVTTLTIIPNFIEIRACTELYKLKFDNLAKTSFMANILLVSRPLV